MYSLNVSCYRIIGGSYSYLLKDVSLADKDDEDKEAPKAVDEVSRQPHVAGVAGREGEYIKHPGYTHHHEQLQAQHGAGGRRPIQCFSKMIDAII